jgi:hypothetical protein
MCLHGIIGDIFGGADQLLAEGNWFGTVLGDRFICGWSTGGELPQDLGAAKFC